MKKILATLVLASAGTAFAADFVSVSVDHVTNRATGVTSTAQYLRAGKEIDGIQYSVMSRTARNNNGTGLFNSIEGTVGKNYQVQGITVTPYVGAAYDNTKNGSSTPFYYGVTGVTAGTRLGSGRALVGVKTRALTTAAVETTQTLGFVQYSYPVAKDLSLFVGSSYSVGDIKERAFGAGISVGF
jgi:hypothetical protein